jgi:hypothetical protein
MRAPWHATGVLTVGPELLGVGYTVAVEEGTACSQGRVHVHDTKSLVGKAIDDGPATPNTVTRAQVNQSCLRVSRCELLLMGLSSSKVSQSRSIKLGLFNIKPWPVGCVIPVEVLSSLRMHTTTDQGAFASACFGARSRIQRGDCLLAPAGSFCETEPPLLPKVKRRGKNAHRNEGDPVQRQSHGPGVCGVSPYTVLRALHLPASGRL